MFFYDSKHLIKGLEQPEGIFKIPRSLQVEEPQTESPLAFLKTATPEDLVPMDRVESKETVFFEDPIELMQSVSESFCEAPFKNADPVFLEMCQRPVLQRGSKKLSKRMETVLRMFHKKRREDLLNVSETALQFALSRSRSKDEEISRLEQIKELNKEQRSTKKFIQNSSNDEQ